MKSKNKREKPNQVNQSLAARVHEKALQHPLYWTLKPNLISTLMSIFIQMGVKYG